MASFFSIPVTAESQTFSATLAGVEYRLTLIWRYGCGYVLDIADLSSAPIVCGIPLVTGTNLLGQFAYLGLGGGLYVFTGGDLDAPPTFDGLGSDSLLIWVTP